MTDQHATSVIVLGDVGDPEDDRPVYRAVCSCGRHWRPQADRRVAEIQAEQHLEYHCEVRAMMEADDA